MMVDVRCGWWKAGWTSRRASWPQVSGLHARLNETDCPSAGMESGVKRGLVR